MEPSDVFYDPAGYIRTATANLISRKARIEGPQRVEMRGRNIVQDDVTIRGDLATIRVGRYCLFCQGTVLQPCATIIDGAPTYVTQTFGSLTRIGNNCLVEAAYIGSGVVVGDNCKISARAIIKDCCYIADNTVIPPDAVIPPFSFVEGSPGKIVGELPPSTATSARRQAVAFYKKYKPAPTTTPASASPPK